MRRSFYRYAGGIALLLSACSQEPERARHTVEDYRENKELRETTLAECGNDPGTLGQHPDCVNAQLAASLEGRGSLRTAPPVGLDPSRNPFGQRDALKPDEPSTSTKPSTEQR